MEKFITAREYLAKKGISFREVGTELITHCVFSNCDADSKGTEAHLYIHAETGQYNCKKCGAKGNLITLAKHLGDTFPTSKPFDSELVDRCNADLPDRIKKYLNERGITDELISNYKLGWGKFYVKNWITIPITDKSGNYVGFKLRQDPDDLEKSVKYKVYPFKTEATIYGWDSLRDNINMAVICEGELDRLVLVGQGIPAITSTAGAGTFKEHWIKELEGLQKVYVCLDKDEAGAKGTERLLNLLADKLPNAQVFKLTLPDRITEGKDITDYFTKYEGNPDELIYTLAEQTNAKIDTSQFQPLTADDLAEILSLTIKEDKANKVITFLCQLSAYTENVQFNISYNAPSSTGKSYIPTEIAKLFPQQDVQELGFASPTSFFHDAVWDENSMSHVMDLSRKILIFLDQPHTQLLERMRPLLSHDKKEITVKITDKKQQSGLRTKTIRLIGYPAVIFCTARLQVDEQETTRMLLLSPEISDLKTRKGVSETIRKEADNAKYQTWLEQNPNRSSLKLRLQAIRQARIGEIKISDEAGIEKTFLGQTKNLKPRMQRDVKRLLSFIKCFALLNLWQRERQGSDIVANDQDIEEGFKLWNEISRSQMLGLPPYVYKFYQNIIEPMLKENTDGISRQELLQKYYTVNGQSMDAKLLAQEILPMLEGAGLIQQEPDPENRRRMLVHPPASDPMSEHRDSESGVKKSEQPDK